MGVKNEGLADEVLNTRELKPEEVRAKVVAMNRGRGVDAVIVTTGAIPAYQNGLAILRPEGRLMVVGFPLKEFPMSLTPIAMMAIRYV
jgi:Threonine dehydrogenase and related Zn-dependent dehydrogenases